MRHASLRCQRHEQDEQTQKNNRNKRKDMWLRKKSAERMQMLERKIKITDHNRCNRARLNKYTNIYEDSGRGAANILKVYKFFFENYI